MAMKVIYIPTGKEHEIAEWLYEKNPTQYKVIEPKKTRKPKAEKKVVEPAVTAEPTVTDGKADA